MMTKSSETEYLQPRELAERWRGVVSLSTIENWRSQNRGPRFLKIGGRVLYPVAEVEAYELRNLRGMPNHPPTQSRQ